MEKYFVHYFIVCEIYFSNKKSGVHDEYTFLYSSCIWWHMIEMKNTQS